jgi:hypothetical protein
MISYIHGRRVRRLQFALQSVADLPAPVAATGTGRSGSERDRNSS